MSWLRRLLLLAGLVTGAWLLGSAGQANADVKVEIDQLKIAVELPVVDVGLKALGMDHGDPTVEGGGCWFVSDEHTTFGWGDGGPLAVGDRVRVLPAHVDPTVAYHETMHVVRGEEVVDEWPVDLRGW